MERKRILVVDDHVDNVELLTVMLADKYDVLGYASAEEALRAVGQVKADLLVLDVRMYPVDGVQCLEAIRAMPGYGTIPALALTALARDTEKAALLTAGFQNVVTKPILDVVSLKKTIESLLETPSRLSGQVSLHGEASVA